MRSGKLVFLSVAATMLAFILAFISVGKLPSGQSRYCPPSRAVEAHAEKDQSRGKFSVSWSWRHVWDRIEGLLVGGANG